MKHYTKAAEKLCISQPSLSHAISQMEKELGVHLFEKDRRNTTLTRFGIAIVPYMDLLMKLDIDVLEIDSPSYKRDFYIVWDDSVYMPPVVKDFKDFVSVQIKRVLVKLIFFMYRN